MDNPETLAPRLHKTFHKKIARKVKRLGMNPDARKG